MRPLRITIRTHMRMLGIGISVISRGSLSGGKMEDYQTCSVYRY